MYSPWFILSPTFVLHKNCWTRFQQFFWDGLDNLIKPTSKGRASSSLMCVSWTFHSQFPCLSHVSIHIGHYTLVLGSQDWDGTELLSIIMPCRPNAGSTSQGPSQKMKRTIDYNNSNLCKSANFTFQFLDNFPRASRIMYVLLARVVAGQRSWPNWASRRPSAWYVF